MTAIKNGYDSDALAAWQGAGFTGALTDNTGADKVGTCSRPARAPGP